MRTTKLLLTVGVLVATGAQAQAPTWSDEQAAVWTVVERSWDSQVAEDGKWPADYTHEMFVEWEAGLKAPRDRETYIAWQRLTDAASDTVWRETTPLAITVVDDTAVVMYSATLVFEDSAGEQDSAVISLVEVLIRDGQSWEYLASSNFLPSYGN